MSAPLLHLKPGKERLPLQGHPWIFSGAIADLDPTIPPGSVVAVAASTGQVIGHGYVNPRCAISVRMLTRGAQPIGPSFCAERAASALALRRTILPPETDAYRLLNGEGDGLPGVVADVYSDTVVLQCLTAGAERLKPAVVDALKAALNPACVYERSAGAVRREEGLEPSEQVLLGRLPREPLTICESGLRFEVDFARGQKTGFFVDQRDNRRLARELAGGRDVLNAFAYTGAFSVYAAAGGAKHVVSVESSASALDAARRNWTLNGIVESTAEFAAADVFRYLREQGRTFDLLILDPPALVKRRGDVARGARAYKDLHLWALRRAAPGAFLLTFSCSQHVSADLFRKIVHGAAADAGRSVQVLRVLGPGADHPISLAHPEGEYLTGLMLRII